MGQNLAPITLHQLQSCSQISLSWLARFSPFITETATFKTRKAPRNPCYETVGPSSFLCPLILPEIRVLSPFALPKEANYRRSTLPFDLPHPLYWRRYRTRPSFVQWPAAETFVKNYLVSLKHRIWIFSQPWFQSMVWPPKHMQEKTYRQHEELEF